MNEEFILGDPLNSQYQYTSQYPNHYQTTYHNFNNHYSNHANSYIQNLVYRYPNAVQWGGYRQSVYSPQRLETEVNLELSFTCSSYSIYFIIFS